MCQGLFVLMYKIKSLLRGWGKAKGYKNPIPFLGGVVRHSHQSLYIMKKSPAHLSGLSCNLQSFFIIKKPAATALVSAKTQPEFRNDFQSPTAISAQGAWPRVPCLGETPKGQRHTGTEHRVWAQKYRTNRFCCTHWARTILVPCTVLYKVQVQCTKCSAQYLCSIEQTNNRKKRKRQTKKHSMLHDSSTSHPVSTL